MHEIGSRRRSQPAPPHVVFEALTQPNRTTVRPWLMLLDDEQPPTVGGVRSRMKLLINEKLRITFGQ